MRHLALVVLLAACAPKASAPLDPVPPAPHADSAMLAPPFDAAALRAGFPVGTVMRYRITEGGEPRIEEWTVTSADAVGSTMHTKVFGPDGTTLLEEGDHTSTWAELEGHGTFPAATTTRSDSTIDVDAGHLATWYYEEAPAEPGGLTRRFHFAPTHVGPPVWAEFRMGDTVVVTLELLSRSGP